ncbi:MAG: serine hydrolase domain-containing protein [Planctomycetota bacterium]
MKTCFRFYLILLATLLSSGRHVALADDDEANASTGERIEAFVDLVHERIGFSGVVLAGRDGEIVSVIARGNANADEALNTNSLFEIASCTKPFTAVAVLRLAEQGKLDLDDSLSKHLPGVPENCKAITIQHLLNHTSGIPGSNTRGSGDDLSAVLPTFLDGGSRSRPGLQHEYWNQGYSLLSEVIARANGTTYTETMRELVFEPSQMDASCFTGDSAPRGFSIATGRSSMGPSRSALEHPYGSYGFQYRGMGGLVTNVHDLWKWDRALADRSLLSPSSVNEMITPGPGDYGLGWQLSKSPDGSPSHGHRGRVRGFLAQVQRYPSVDGAIFVLVNDDRSSTFSVIAQGVEQILFGEEPKLEFPGELDPKRIDAIAGTYVDSQMRKLVVEDVAGLPELRIEWGGPVTRGYLGLEPDGKPHLYLLSLVDGSAKFKNDGPLKIEMKNERAKSISLEVLNPPLVFKRQP